jgi:phosphopantetheine adenylyltransferase
VKGNKTPASQSAMPIPIIIAVLIALFTLGAKMNQQKGSPARVVIVGGKQYNVVDEKDNRNTLVVIAAEQNGHTVIIKGQRETASFENIFQLLGLYQIIKAEPMTPINNSINSNMKQAVCLSEKE